MKSSDIWFTADTHFGSERTLELSKRPFKNTTEMDYEIIKNWNDCVGHNDIVYHLGDFGDYDIIDYLNGHIFLILGNYELDDIDKGIITIDTLKQMGFVLSAELTSDFICCSDSKSNNNCFSDRTIWMTHKPEDCDKDRFNLFGHIHGLQKVKRYGLNVGVDCHYFKPINLEEVLWWKNAIENHYDNNVFD